MKNGPVQGCFALFGFGWMPEMSNDLLVDGLCQVDYFRRQLRWWARQKTGTDIDTNDKRLWT